MSGFCGSKDPLDDDEETTMIEEPKSDTIPAPPPGERPFQRIEREHKEWVDRNFPSRLQNHPLLGIVEEVGELYDAHCGLERDEEGVHDALGDICIFTVDYCRLVGINFGGCWEAARLLVPNIHVGQKSATRMLVLLGRLCRHQLKMEQSVRGTREQHLQGITTCVTVLLAYLATDFGGGLEDVAGEVWDKVKQRDWVAERAARA